MQHRIDPARGGPRTEPMAHAVESCVHCGFCLPACPTYQLLGEEMDSPRGRIYLMKEALEGAISITEVAPFVDRCLGCLACETACPSGVQYGELLTSFRPLVERRGSRGFAARLRRRIVTAMLSSPPRLRAALTLARLARPFRHALPSRLRAALELIPDRLPPRSPLPAFSAAVGRRRGRVALLGGCAQQVLAPWIGWATLRVLVQNGVEVVVPRAPACCGALAMHAGVESQAIRRARRVLVEFPADVDAVVVNAAGCGSAMKEYPLLFRGLDLEANARAFVSRVRDVSEYLVALGIASPGPLARPLRIAYHDACHLSHAQGLRAEPRQVLAAVPNVTVVEPQDAETCCGSAGTYNIEEPLLAAELGGRKAENLAATAADAVAAGNIGCIAQIESHLRRRGTPLPVVHVVEVLDLAYGGPVRPGGLTR